jgi:hypothetical protein
LKLKAAPFLAALKPVIRIFLDNRLMLLPTIIEGLRRVEFGVGVLGAVITRRKAFLGG